VSADNCSETVKAGTTAGQQIDQCLEAPTTMTPKESIIAGRLDEQIETYTYNTDSNHTE
jgi:hypothetical protein